MKRLRKVDPFPRPRPSGLPESFLVDREVAEIMDISVSTLRRWRDEGKTPPRVNYPLAGQVWERAVVMAWAESRQPVRNTPHPVSGSGG